MHTLILHNIRSTHNVGALFRTAEGFGVREIILSGYTPYPKLPDDRRLPHIAEKLTKQIHKTALGAESLVPFKQFETQQEMLAYIEAQQLPLTALEQDEASVSLYTFTPKEPIALLLGEEVDGISNELLNHCSNTLEIPMVGKKESFNVSVAAGIALYQLYKPTA